MRPPTTATTPPVAPSGSGCVEPPSGSGWLPEIPLVQWERKKDGAVEAWHTPTPNAPRRERTYLKRVGKRLQAEWWALPEGQRRAIIAQWVNQQREEKGITISPEQAPR